MSPYTVLTIIRKESDSDLESMLAPYDENMEVAPYVRHTKAELIAKKREEAARIAHDIPLAETHSEDEYHRLEDAYYRYDYVLSDAGRACAALVDAPDDEVFEAVKKDYDEDSLNADGDYVSTYNPNSKWDWYQVGGRWEGALKLKRGGSTSEALAGEIDWDKMFSLDPKRRKRASEFWDEYVLQKLPTEMQDRTVEEVNKYLNDKFGFIFYKREYYLERYKDKEEYLRRLAIWTTYAVLDEKGWHAPGEMGWFGCSNETADAQRDWDENFRSRFIDTLGPEDMVFIVDCHI